MEITRLSTKGQLILPKSLRDAYRWRPGTEFLVQEVAGGVLLRPKGLFAPARLEDVFGCLPYAGRAKTPAQMNRAWAKEVRRRRGRGRY